MCTTTESTKKKACSSSPFLVYQVYPEVRDMHLFNLVENGISSLNSNVQNSREVKKNFLIYAIDVSVSVSDGLVDTSR